MSFQSLYTELISEAVSINPIFEYIEDDRLLLENPDDFYNVSGSHCFLFQGDFYAADTDKDADGTISHGDMLMELEAYYINDDPVTIEMAFGGTLSPELESFFERSYAGEIQLTRDNFLNELPFSVMGRINLDEKIISFWNPAGSFNKENIDQTLWVISTVYDGKPEEYKYEIAEDLEYFDSTLLSYEEFRALNPKLTKTLKSRTDHILHTLDPSIKGQVMKQRGIKPKRGLGAEMRFAMGESFISLYNKLLLESTADKDIFAVFVVSKNSDNLFAATTRCKDKGEDECSFGFPGGKVDFGESLIDAVTRESLEEGFTFEYIEPEPFHVDIVEGRKVAWFYGKNPIQLNDYKEKHRLRNIFVSEQQLISSGDQFKNVTALQVAKNKKLLSRRSYEGEQFAQSIGGYIPRLTDDIDGWSQ
jgi:hypothetical protein